MSFDAENIIKDSKTSEESKSPGRRAAEERAERIRYAEEYRKKLEAEKAPVQPKKTKAAEQKEQEKLEKIAREQEAKRARLEEERLESERRIAAAKEKLESLGKSIEEKEAAPQTVEVMPALEQTIDATEGEQQGVPEIIKPFEPVKIAKNLVVHIPVQSFNIPCVVKVKKTEPAAEPVKQEAPVCCGQYVQPMLYPVVPPAVMMQPIAPVQPMVNIQNDIAETQSKMPVKPKAVTEKKPEATPPQKPEAAPAPKVQNLNKENYFDDDPVFRPAIMYGAVVTEGGWEHEIEDEDYTAAGKNNHVPEEQTSSHSDNEVDSFDIDEEQFNISDSEEKSSGGAEVKELSKSDKQDVAEASDILVDKASDVEQKQPEQ